MSHFLKPLFRNRGCALHVEGTGICLARELEAAFDSTARKKGLLGRDPLPQEAALVIAPTQGVHTFGMRATIDIVAVSRDGRVVKTRAAVPPRRMVFALTAFAFIELASGAIARAGVRPGDRLMLMAPPPAKHS